MQLRYLIPFIILSLSPLSFLCAEYSIKGKVNLQGEWQNLIYLATIDKLDDYYSAKAEYIINMATIDNEGNFLLTGENLPEHPQFYKLYLVREEHSEFNACLYVGGENHNFIHIILDNDTDLEIFADQSTFAPFGDYEITGDAENQRMKSLSRLVYPSYMFYEIRFPSELKFSQNKLNKDLFQFADTCSSTLVSLAAINNTDFDDYYPTFKDTYRMFENELQSNLSAHPYTINYSRKLRYYSDETFANSNIIWKLLAFVLGLSTLLLVIWNFKIRARLREQMHTKAIDEIPSFTERELHILEGIVNGKSNKEIASELFIELSTVKSHINKLYSKMSVNNRQEAKRKAKTMPLSV